MRDPHPGRLAQLTTQLAFRLARGRGEAFYYLGVQDDGYPRGLAPPELARSV